MDCVLYVVRPVLLTMSCNSSSYVSSNKPLPSKEMKKGYRERIKSDPVKYAEYQEKEQLRWAQGKKKRDTIKEMSQSDQREPRRA